MRHPEDYNDNDLAAAITHRRAAIKEYEDDAATALADLTLLITERTERRRRRPVEVPYMILELLTAHAAKRYDNIAPGHQTAKYHSAIRAAYRLLGREVLPRDIEGEHHGSGPRL